MKIGRNEKCPCGSKLKYKKCCLSAPDQGYRPIMWEKPTLPRVTEQIPERASVKHLIESGQAGLKHFFKEGDLKQAAKIIAMASNLAVDQSMNSDPQIFWIAFSVETPGGIFSKRQVHKVVLNVRADGIILLPNNDADGVLAVALLTYLLRPDEGKILKVWNESVGKASALVRSFLDKSNPPIKLFAITVHSQKLTATIVRQLGPAVSVPQPSLLGSSEIAPDLVLQQKLQIYRADIQAEQCQFILRAIDDGSEDAP